jgi:hypothetical protein
MMSFSIIIFDVALPMMSRNQTQLTLKCNCIFDMNLILSNLRLFLSKHLFILMINSVRIIGCWLDIGCWQHRQQLAVEYTV